MARTKADRLNEDVQASMVSANRAHGLYGLSMQVFQANAQRYDFVAAEAEREKLHAHLDDYLDNFMAANRRVEAG
jgi:hypothetical protein